jgi:hypothetical protein
MDISRTSSSSCVMATEREFGDDNLLNRIIIGMGWNEHFSLVIAFVSETFFNVLIFSVSGDKS